MPGRESAILADPGGSGHTWINPARIADSGAGFDVGYAATGNVGGIRSVFHVPGSYAIGYEYVSLAAPRPYYSQSPETEGFHVLSLAKRGFGAGSWLEGLRLGASLRYAVQVHEFNRYDGYKEVDENVWALDAGISLDVPLPEYQGRLTLGSLCLAGDHRNAGPAPGRHPGEVAGPHRLVADGRNRRRL